MPGAGPGIASPCASPPRRAARDVRAGAPATVVKRAYRTLSLKAHPDKGGDPARFRLITQAYKALAGDATSRSNYRLHGHPDGPRQFFAGFALPPGSEGLMIGIYALLFALALLPLYRLSGSGRARAGVGGASARAARATLTLTTPQETFRWENVRP